VGVTPFKNNGISFAVNAEWKIFKNIVNKVFDNVSPHKQHEIQKKWIGIIQVEYFSSSAFIWTICITSVILVGFIIVYYWNSVLKKIIKRKKETEKELKKLLIEVKKRDEDKKVLLQEIHHRVKNNLQIVSSMLSMQANSSQDASIGLALKGAIERIQTISLVHNKIYKSPTLDKVNLTDYTQSLFQDIQSQYPIESHTKLLLNSSSINITIDYLVPLALIINELITNSFKHAFINQDFPEISMQYAWNQNTEMLQMTYNDNGQWIENPESDHFGTSLIDILTEQINGNYSLDSNSDGTFYTFEFKIPIINT
jgi:two-component sensor histidine kinase